MFYIILIKKTFIVFIFVLVFVYASSAVANAQTAVSYAFLEVVDSNKKPVANATVETTGFKAERKKETDDKGKATLEIYRGDYTTRGFKVFKDGFFPYEELFSLWNFRNFSQEIFKLELLKIPQTEAERKVLGNEQIKREFILAVKNGDIVSVRRFLKAGISPNLTTTDLRGVPGIKDIPVLVFAIGSDNLSMVEELLKAGAKVKDAEVEKAMKLVEERLNRISSYNANGNEIFIDKMKRIVELLKAAQSK